MLNNPCKVCHVLQKEVIFSFDNLHIFIDIVSPPVDIYRFHACFLRTTNIISMRSNKHCFLQFDIYQPQYLTVALWSRLVHTKQLTREQHVEG